MKYGGPPPDARDACIGGQRSHEPIIHRDGQTFAALPIHGQRPGDAEQSGEAGRFVRETTRCARCGAVLERVFRLRPVGTWRRAG